MKKFKAQGNEVINASTGRQAVVITTTDCTMRIAEETAAFAAERLNELAASEMPLDMPQDAHQQILQRLDALTFATVELVRTMGARLTRAEMCNRLGITSNTLTSRVRRGHVPTPGKDGKWLLAEVIEWESRGG